MDVPLALILFLLAQFITLIVYVWKQMSDQVKELKQQITKLMLDASNDRLKYVKSEALEPLIDERVELHRAKCENDLMNNGRIPPRRRKSET